MQAPQQQNQFQSLQQQYMFQNTQQKPQPQISQQQNLLQTSQQQNNQKPPASSAPLFGNMSQLGTASNPTFSFMTPQNIFNSKAVVSQPPLVSSTNTATEAKEASIKEKPITEGIFGGKTNLPQSTPIKASEGENKAAVKSENLIAEIDSKVKESSGLPETQVSAVPEPPAVDDSVYWNALRDEIDHFNSELQTLFTKAKTLNIKVCIEKLF